MRYAENVLDLIGHTPLVRLHSVTRGLSATVLAKVEYLNPGGSIKDRIALRMIEGAEASGELAPGGTIVEPTSGNTGVGLALVGALKGYRTVFVTPDKVGEEKRAVLRAYGAQVVVTPSAVAPDSAESYYGVSDAIVAATPGAYKPDQFSNPAAPASHEATTGPEIWEDTDQRVTHVVIGAGTGGTITGTGRYLKAVSAQRPSGPVSVIAADPDGSVYSGGTGRPYFTEGVGEDMWPGNYDPEVPDRVEAVTDAEAFAMTRRLAREEGLLVGGSSGMAVVAALRVARDLGPDDVLVVILPDSGRGYLGKIFDDAWMSSHGFDTAPALPDAGAHPLPTGADAPSPAGAASFTSPRGDRPAQPAAASSSSVAGALAALGRAPRRGLGETATVSEALGALADAGVPALPVVAAGAPWPAREGEVRGSVSVAGLAQGLASALLTGETPLSRALEPALPTLGAGLEAAALFPACAQAAAVAILKDGDLIDVATATDLARTGATQPHTEGPIA